VLLDTHAFLWIIGNSPRLGKKAKRIFLDEKTECFLSTASVWEMAIKISIGKLQLEPDSRKQPDLATFLVEHLEENEIAQLNISFEHAAGTQRLPLLHRDPFDRMLVAQAQKEDLTILSADPIFSKYGVKRIW